MLTRKLSKQNFEKEVVEYPHKSFNMKFLYADHTDDCLGFIPHLHEELEFLYVVRGKAEIRCGNTIYHAKAGDIFVFNSNEIHSCLKTYSGYYTYCLQFLPSFLSSKLVDVCEYNYIRPLTKKRANFKTLYQNNPELIELFEKCEKEFQAKKHGYHIALKGYVYAFLSQIYRLNEHLESETIHHETINHRRVGTVINHINENFSTEIDFRKLVEDMFLHYSYFSRVFKEQTGKSMRQYLHEYRLTTALNLLSSTDKNVTEVALECGFDDLNYFSRAFKELIGLSPSNFKKTEMSRRKCKV